jgi:uncharacterized protein
LGGVLVDARSFPYPGSMRTLIDGYNVMHAKGLMLAKFGPDGLRKARLRFLMDLAAALDPLEAVGTTIVFDAALPPADRPDRHTFKGMTILFAVGDDDADTRIEALIAAHSTPRSLTVVSTDLRIRKAAERRRARVVTSDEYLSRLAEGRKGKVELPPPKPTAEEVARRDGLAAAESAYWLAEFADVANEPGVGEALRASDFVPTDEEIARIEREVREERF